MSSNGPQSVDSPATSVGGRSELDTAGPWHRASSARFIRFGPFELDLKKGFVTKSGSRIALTGKKYKVLIMLLEKPGEIVSRDAFYRDLWPNHTVLHKDFSLATIINNLRRVLEDSSFGPRYIETIPRRGYVFVAPLEVSQHSSPRAASASLAVLPSRFFSIRRIVSLVLIGMVLGAMAVWISNHVRPGGLGPPRAESRRSILAT